MDWKAVARTALAPLTGGLAPYQAALLQPPAQKLQFIPGYQAALIGTGGYDTPLIHGPGATELATAPSAHGDGNSAVYACLAALCMAYIEPPKRVYRRTGPGKREEVTAGPGAVCAQLLQTPNPVMSGAEVWAWWQWAKHIDGNAYLRKIRSGNKTTGNVTELWPISPRRIELRSEGAYISAYRYHYGPGQFLDIPPANIIHGRIGLDDRDHRRGLSPLKRLVRTLTTDAAAEAWAERLLSNGAIPGLLIKAKVALDKTQADEMKAWARTLYGGERLGDVGVLDNGAEMEQFGFSPEQMAFDAVRRQPETRISAVLRVPAIVAGLAAGLERATYANFREAREAFTEQTLLPLWTMDEAKLQSQLLPDFTTDRALIIAHDLSDVRALQEDEDAKYGRLDKAVQGGWVTINEARQDVGLETLDTGDVRRVPIAVTEVPITAAASPPAEPIPAEPTAATPGTEPPVAPTPIRQAASRRAAERKAEEGDPAVVTEADLAAWRARARALAEVAPLLPDLLAATAGSANGNGQH